MSKRLHRLVKNQSQVDVIQQSADTDVAVAWSFALVAFAASVFYFWSYYFWALWGAF